MGLKKIARPINNAKNQFMKWLKDHNAERIHDFEGEPANGWDYYRHIHAFIGERLISVYFTMWKGEVSIDYFDEDNRYHDMSVEEFLQLIS